MCYRTIDGKLSVASWILVGQHRALVQNLKLPTAMFLTFIVTNAHDTGVTTLVSLTLIPALALICFYLTPYQIQQSVISTIANGV
mmetsp:Transcript_34077/g.74710  ORF Transcript_34077/g.74710 Transcript_34077/m.74710 type:complete len:85 (+) Transcript_34077:783-1037(+)